MIEPDQYFLGYRKVEQERLERQAIELANESSALLRHLEDPRTLVLSSDFIQVWGLIPK